MDKKHVFADKLELVTSFVFYKNGVIACAAPDIWNLQDTDGDGVCRQAREALHRPRHRRHARGDQQSCAGACDGWVYATHGYSVGRCHLAPTASRNFGTDRLAASCASSPTARAFEQYSSTRRQHLGPRHHLGRPGLLDAAHQRHRVLPRRAARVCAGQRQDPRHHAAGRA